MIHKHDSHAPQDSVTDISEGDWIDLCTPLFWRPYLRLMRLDRSIGTWLLLFPCWWGVSLAAASQGQLPDPFYLMLFTVGAIIMRGAGCVINDLADRNFDPLVARTANRPIASGALSVRQALLFLALLLGLGFLILLCFNSMTIFLGGASLLLVILYPFTKRITWWPQAFLGLTFNWGALLGWTAEIGSLMLSAQLLYCGGFFWTLGYDTIYAHQDKYDDQRIGIKSSALALGKVSRSAVLGFYAAAILFWGGALYSAGISWPGWLGLGLAGVFGFHLTMQVDFDQPQACLRAFKANRRLGWALFLGLCASSLVETGLGESG